MSWINGVRARLRRLVFRRAGEERMDEEIRLHIEMETEKNVREGMSPGEARRRAVLAFGGVEKHREEMRDDRGFGWIESVARDVRYAVRVVARTPSFALAVIGVLALGIGAATAIFSIANAVLLRPLPFEEPERLVRIFTRTGAGTNFELSPGKFYSWQEQAQSFEGMAIYPCCGFRKLALTGTGAARTLNVTRVSAGFFDIVRLRPALGRAFLPEEDSPDARHVVILSDRFWKTELGGAADVIGRTVMLDDQAYTVVGVMPPEASAASWGPMGSDVWVPIGLTAEQRASRGNHNLDGFARLKPHVDVREAQAEMDAISARLAREYPESDEGWGAAVVPLQDDIVGDSRQVLVMLLGAVGLVLLIASANVGNLLFTRALGRRRELAIRSALGAGRRRVFQQVLIEALLLAAAGGLLGLLFAYLALAATSMLLASQVPRAGEISIDVRVLLFVAVVSVLAGVLAGAPPAVRAGRSNLNDALRESRRGDGAIGIGTRRVLVACEVALSLVLLMGAGVMIQSLLALRHGDIGFDPADVLTIEVTLPESRYPTPAPRTAFFDAALEQIRALPGVQAVGTIDDVPLMDGSAQTLELEGYPPQSDPPAVQVRQISPGYLSAMRIPLLRGRDVVASDAEVLLVSEAAAELYWGTDDPIGSRATLPYSQTVRRRVVGIVGDVKQRNLVEPVTPTVYFQTREPYGRATFAIRTSGSPDALRRSAVAAIRGIDPEVPIGEVRTMEDVLDAGLGSQRFSTLLLAVFACVALLLAAIGIYSVLSYIVRGQSREIGIRAALGARTPDILRLVIIEGMAPALVGIVCGAIGALGSAKVMESLVFGVSASDPLTLAGVAVSLAVVALLACVAPAYRAVRVDPVKALRGS